VTGGGARDMPIPGHQPWRNPPFAHSCPLCTPLPTHPDPPLLVTHQGCGPVDGFSPYTSCGLSVPNLRSRAPDGQTRAAAAPIVVSGQSHTRNYQGVSQGSSLSGGRLWDAHSVWRQVFVSSWEGRRGIASMRLPCAGVPARVQHDERCFRLQFFRHPRAGGGTRYGQIVLTRNTLNTRKKNEKKYKKYAEEKDMREGGYRMMRATVALR
jgi:hypothetical protein